jgi:hypothetical protein
MGCSLSRLASFFGGGAPPPRSSKYLEGSQPKYSWWVSRYGWYLSDSWGCHKWFHFQHYLNLSSSLIGKRERSWIRRITPLKAWLTAQLGDCQGPLLANNSSFKSARTPRYTSLTTSEPYPSMTVLIVRSSSVLRRRGKLVSDDSSSGNANWEHGVIKASFLHS